MGIAALIVVPYALARLPANAFAGGGCRVRHLVIDPARPGPLRLNSGLLDFRDAPTAETLRDVDAQIGYVREVLKSYCDTWQPLATLFLDRYFEFLAAQIATHREALAAALAPFGAMFDVRQWTYSAWQPLPQAHVAAAPGEWLRFDFAFWGGTRFLLVDIAGDGMASTRRRAAIDRLGNAGHQVIAVPAAALRDGDPGAFAAFPAGFVRFWDGERLPAGPFRPRGLADPVPAVEA